ncbi:hypothetical protein QBC46DRAFT_337652 [Diplogelasinospora grovesii]|uniref:Uncharacterized protein n=1 Tax=Diplogelasinospora grovesii TaxID=303347 RepID=A0AAN6NFP7_9PEZI|nr:hypothetical protein QBC46DRAFT_337652 [Diplogelasinospora grovesii]
MGGQNCRAEVVFADSVVWLARFRLSSPTSPPLEVRGLRAAERSRDHGVSAALHACMARRWTGREQRLRRDVFLVHQFRLDVLDSVWKSTPAAVEEDEKFFLKHADDKGDHILVKRRLRHRGRHRLGVVQHRVKGGDLLLAVHDVAGCRLY